MPLRLEYFGPGGRGATAVEATRLVVKDGHGNPVILAVEHAPGQYIVADFRDDDWEELLATFGLRPAAVRTVTPGE